MNKAKIYSLAGTGAAILGFGLTALAHADAFVVPTSTAPSLTAIVGDQLADPGTLAVIALAVGVPLAFYIIHQLIGLVPKGRAKRA